MHAHAPPFEEKIDVDKGHVRGSVTVPTVCISLFIIQTVLSFFVMLSDLKPCVIDYFQTILSVKMNYHYPWVV